MSKLKGVTGLALACSIGFAACDSPAMLAPSAPEINASATGPKSSGAPTLDRQTLHITRVIPCTLFGFDFDALQRIDARIDSKTWVNDDGSIRSKAHVQGRVTFTNLVTGLVITNDVSFNEEVLVSADGLLAVIRSSGLLLKVRREAKGRQLAYRMGHSVLTIDFSTVPPTFDGSFDGREDFGAGPCADLNNPA